MQTLLRASGARGIRLRIEIPVHLIDPEHHPRFAILDPPVSVNNYTDNRWHRIYAIPAHKSDDRKRFGEMIENVRVHCRYLEFVTIN
jgi:hypothetical protein